MPSPSDSAAGRVGTSRAPAGNAGTSPAGASGAGASRTSASPTRASGDNASRASVGLSAVIISVDETTPRLLTVRRGEALGLPSTHLDDSVDRTLQQGVRRLVSGETGLAVRYFEQLYTFGDRGRAPGGRELAVAYLALARYQAVGGPNEPSWLSCYDLFPWEDWRSGRPALLDDVILPAIDEWLAASTLAELPTRLERAELTFGVGHALWDPVRVLDRYELAYELGIVEEARPAGVGTAASGASASGTPVTGALAAGRVASGTPATGTPASGTPAKGTPASGTPASGTAASGTPGTPVSGTPAMGIPLALDHRRIAAAALERLRGKLAYRPVVFEVLPETFTLSRLQQVVEALAGQVLHKQNFRRLVASANLVEPTGEWDQRTGGRPAELYRFRREVLRERPAPGLGLRRLGGP